MRLITRDGRIFDFDLMLTGVTGVEELNGNRLTINPAGITQSSCASIDFTRDAEDRLTEIVDPRGPAVKLGLDSVEWPTEWSALTEEQAESARTELLRELPQKHVLDELPIQAIGARLADDDYLFLVEALDFRLACVHLTWNKEVDPAWPHTETFKTVESWRIAMASSSDKSSEPF